MLASFECFGSGPEYFLNDNTVWHCSFLRGFSYLMKASVCVTAEGPLHVHTISFTHGSTSAHWKTNSIFFFFYVFAEYKDLY